MMRAIAMGGEHGTGGEHGAGGKHGTAGNNGLRISGANGLPAGGLLAHGSAPMDHLQYQPKQQKKRGCLRTRQSGKAAFKVDGVAEPNKLEDSKHSGLDASE